MLINNLTQLPNEVNDFSPMPQDNQLSVLSPIDEINNNLENYNKFIKIAHVNAVSLPKYRDEISRVANKTKLDIIGISETNIKKNTPSDLFKIDGYKLFHVNRDHKNSGGVGIFINNLYSPKAKKIEVNFKEKQPEIIFVEVEINKTKILIGVIYKSPSVRYGVFSDISEYLAFFSTKYEHAIFLGDFNIDQLKVNTPAFKYFKDNIILPLSLTQIIDTPTRITKDSCTLLDLILVNSLSNVKYTGNTFISGNLDHSMVYCAYSVRKQKFQPQIIKRRDFRSFASDRFKLEMQNALRDGIIVTNETDIDIAAETLEKVFINVINNNAPVREIKVTKPVCASWMNDEIIFLMDLRDKYRNKWNEIKRNKSRLNINHNSHDLFFYNRYKELKNTVNHAIRKAKINDFNNKINNKIGDSKKFHFELKKFNVVSSKSTSSKCFINPDKLNECFAKNNNTKINDNNIEQMVRNINNSRKECRFSFFNVTSDDVKEAVKTLKSNACGIDEISAFFIKLSIESSAQIFAEIVNASLKSGYFPSRWKKARIKPIPKVNDPMTASEYRPISLLIVFSKILEKIVSKQMKTFLIENNILDNFQSAYRQKHSTITALIDITNNIYKAMDNAEISILVLLDYSKAFDCANHKLILAKLKSYGFTDLPLKWISSYLSNRSQQVVTDSGESKWIKLLNGVPQGSILGPLLFTILVSDIANNIQNCKYHLYADDTQIYISGKLRDIEKLITQLNNDLERISEFSLNNCLKLNEGKSVFIFIGSKNNISKLNKLKVSDIIINNKIIKRETIVRNLGILFDENLSWDAEINNTISKSHGKLKQAFRHKNFLSKKSKITLAQSYLLSQFNYNSIILQNLSQYQNNKIQKFQNTCTRFILNLRKYDHISAAFKTLGLLNMENSRKMQALTLMHKIIRKEAPKYLVDNVVFNRNVHEHETRSRGNLRPSNFKTNYGRNCFLNKIGEIYNQVTNELGILDTLSVNGFKTKIRNYLLNNQSE